MQHAPQFPLAAIICGCLGGIGALVANLVSIAMIERINGRVPLRDRISCFWWGTEVRRKFKQLYPGNRLVVLLDACIVLVVLSFITILIVDFGGFRFAR